MSGEDQIRLIQSDCTEGDIHGKVMSLKCESDVSE